MNERKKQLTSTIVCEWTLLTSIFKFLWPLIRLAEVRIRILLVLRRNLTLLFVHEINAISRFLIGYFRVYLLLGVLFYHCSFLRVLLGFDSMVSILISSVLHTYCHHFWTFTVSFFLFFCDHLSHYVHTHSYSQWHLWRIVSLHPCLRRWLLSCVYVIFLSFSVPTLRSFCLVDSLSYSSHTLTLGFGWKWHTLSLADRKNF